MDRNKKSLVVKIISVTISFILSFLLFAEVALLIVKSQFINSDALIRSMDSTNYYGELLSEIEDDFISYGMASGFPEKFFNGVIDSEQIKFDITEQTSKIFGGKYSALNTEDIYNDMYNKFIQYANDNNYEVTDEVDKNIKFLTKTCAEHYAECIDIPYASAIAPYIPVLSKYITYGIIIFAVGIIACFLVIFFTQSWKHRSLRYYIYSATTCSLMLIIFPTVIYATGSIKRVAVLSKAMHNLIVCFLQGFLNGFYIAAVISILVVALLLVIHHMIREKSKHSHN